MLNKTTNHAVDEFLKDLALYCYDNCNGYDYSYAQACAMSRIAYKHSCVDYLVYLVQFNYEDCRSYEEWLNSFVHILKKIV